MGIVTTHTEGRVVVHSGDESLPVEVVQLPARDAAVQAAAPPAAPAKVVDAPKPPAATPAVKAAVKQQKARERKAKK